MASPRDDSSGLRRQSVRGGAWAAAGAAGAAGASLVNFLIMSRLLEPAAYGLMGMVETTLALAQRFMQSGLSEPLIQVPDLSDEHSDTMFWSLQAAGLAFAAAIAASSGLIARFFSEPGLVPLLTAMAIIPWLQALSLVPSALLARRFGFYESAQANVLSEAAAGGVGIAAALSGHGVWALVVHRITANVVLNLVLWWKARWRPSLRYSTKALQSVWRYSASRGLEGLLLFIDQQAPRVILGRVAGATELGYFIFARRLVDNSVSLLNAPVRTTALSTFAVIQSDLARVRRVYAEGVSLTTLFMLPAAAGVALVAPYLVEVLAGRTWIPAAALLQIMILTGVRQSFHLWNAAMLRGLGSPQLLLWASLVRTIAILGLILLLLDWRAAGVAWAILAGSLLSWPVAMWCVRQISGISVWDQLRPSRASLLATLLMTAAVATVRWTLDGRFSALPTLTICVLMGLAVYAFVMVRAGKAELAAILRSFEAMRSRRPSAATTEADGTEST